MPDQQREHLTQGILILMNSTTRTGRSEQKRAAVLEAAIAEFQEKGFQGASMDSISSRAGVSKRTVYNHFESKEALFRQIGRQLFQYAAEMTPLSYSAELPLNDQLHEFAEKELRLLASEQFRNMARVMLAECIYSPSLAREAVAQLNEQESDLESWIRSAVSDNRLRPVDAGYAANQFIGLIKAAAFWPQLLMGSPLPDAGQSRQIAADTVAMFLGYYAVQPGR